MKFMLLLSKASRSSISSSFSVTRLLIDLSFLFEVAQPFKVVRFRRMIIHETYKAIALMGNHIVVNVLLVIEFRICFCLNFYPFHYIVKEGGLFLGNIHVGVFLCV